MTKSSGAGRKGSPTPPKPGSGRGSPPRKHVPLRTCVACRQTGSKRALVRIVRTPAAGVQVDSTGKLAGRGAYLCGDRACWEQGLRSQRLSQALKTTLSSEEVEALHAFAATLPERQTVGPEPVAPMVPLPDHE
jgi:predicted RNA-binding protein YlxR (DUF448 family)